MIGSERAIWLLPVAFLVALLLTALVHAGGAQSQEQAMRPAEPPAPVRERTTQPPALLLADVPELPAPLAMREPRRPRTAVAAPRPAPRRASRLVPVANRAPTAQSAPPRLPPAPPPAPAPRPVTPAPAPAPAPVFDDSGSGPEFEDEGTTP